MRRARNRPGKHGVREPRPSATVDGSRAALDDLASDGGALFEAQGLWAGVLGSVVDEFGDGHVAVGLSLGGRHGQGQGEEEG